MPRTRSQRLASVHIAAIPYRPAQIRRTSTTVRPSFTRTSHAPVAIALITRTGRDTRRQHVDGRRHGAHYWQSPGESANPARPTRSACTVPTYQYACTNPDGTHQFEVVQSFTDAPVSECRECGSPVRKVYGSVGVVD